MHDQKEKVEYEQLSQKINKLLEEGKNAEAIKIFLGGIGMPKAFVFLVPLFPGWKTMKALAPTLAYDMSLTSDLPPVTRATQIAVPMEIIVGQKSPASLHSVADQLARAIPNATIVKLAGQDHMVNAKSLLPVITRFLKQ